MASGKKNFRYGVMKRIREITSASSCLESTPPSATTFKLSPTLPHPHLHRACRTMPAASYFSSDVHQPGLRMSLPPMSISQSRVIFIIAAVALLLHTQLFIPWLSDAAGIEIIVSWFLCAGLGVFLPLLIAAWVLLEREGPLRPSIWRERLRFRAMNREDWMWTLGGVLAIGTLSMVIMKLIEAFAGAVHTQPPFMRFEVLGPGRYWILLAWLPFWLLNIMGEEILWRGVMLPRMEEGIGSLAWLHHALGWTVFHVAFGWQLLLTLLPILFILPFIVQRRANSWIGVIIHAVLNGPAFVLIALGVI
jgi:membrane protease YdiL (CAAX protease family)